MDKERNAADGAKSSSLPKKKNKLVWSALSVLIAAATVWAVISQNKNFSFGEFISSIGGASPWWIAAAVLSMAAYIWFEAAALLCILKEFGHRLSPFNGVVYSSADIYFSAITPSATGGQPASAFFMHLDGITGTLAAVVLLGNLLMYSCSTVGIGIISTAIAPLTLSRFSTFSQILIIAGFVIQVALLLLIVLIIKKEKIIFSVGSAIVTFLGKIKIVKNPEEKKKKIAHSMEEYREHASFLSGKKKMMGKVLIYNLLQRIFQILVTVFTYLALGNPARDAVKVFSLQTYTSIGAYCIPIPGSMGVTDYLMLDGFSSVIPDESMIVNFELLSRTLSFYSCIFICGLIVLVSYMVKKRRRTEQ